MKLRRSQINASIELAMNTFHAHGINLPDFAYWAVDGWKDKGKVDGMARDMARGDIVRIRPGQSVCIPPRIIHQFWGEDGTGLTVSGEVSSLCDDHANNYFLEPSARFPKTDEDEIPRYYLCHEYPSHL